MALDFGCGAWCEIVAPNGLAPSHSEHWTAAAGTPSILTSGDWPGGKAYRCAASGAAVSLTRTSAFAAGRVGTARMRINSLPAAERIIVRITTATGSLDITVTSAGVLKAGVTGGTFQTGPTITNTQIFRLGWKVVTNATTWTIDWEVDGVAQTQATQAAMTSGNSTSLAIGAIEASTYTVDFTDVVEANNVNNYPLANGYIKGVYPNGDGTHNVLTGAFRDSGGTNITGATTNAYTFIDDITPIASGTDYLEQQTTDGAAYLEFTLGTRAEPQAPMAVFITGVVAEASASGATGFVALANGSSHFLSADVYAQIGTGKQDFTAVFETPVATATDRDTPWFGTYTWPLARLRWGFSTDAAPDVRLHGIVVEGWYPVVTSGVELVLVGPHDASDGTKTSVAWTVPAGVDEDDVMYAWLAKDYVNEIITAPGGWTIIGSREDAASVETAVLYRKIAGASEPTTTYTWSWTTTNDAELQPFVVRQSNPAATPEAAHAQQSNASSSTLAVPALTVTAQDMLEVALVALNRDGTSVTYQPPGWTLMDVGGTSGTTGAASFAAIAYRHTSAANPPSVSIVVANASNSVGYHLAIGIGALSTPRSWVSIW